MRYMIFDDEGNALASFRSRPAAERRMRAIGAANPQLADDLVMTIYDDDGRFTGQALTLSDIAPPVRIRPTPWAVWLAYAPTRLAPAVHVNRYANVVLAGRTAQTRVVHTDAPAPGVPIAH